MQPPGAPSKGSIGHVCLPHRLSEGPKLSISAALLNGAWLGANAPGYLRFKAALREPRRVQESLLRWYLLSNRQTVFGIQHQFQSIRTAREYQERVPLSTYEDYADAIERIAAGGRDVLT